MLKRVLSNPRGSYTIEATLIMSTVIFVIFLLCFSFMLMYHKVLITNTAGAIAQEAADNWCRGNALYYRVYEMAEGSVALTKTIEGSINMKKVDTQTVKNAVEKEKNSIKEKLQNEQRYAFSRLFKNLRKPEKTVVTIEYRNGLILREIQVDITQDIKIPLGHLKKYFDGKETVTLHSVSKSVITDPAEYIRDTDLAIEYGVKAKKTINFDKLIKQVSGI